MLLYKSTTKLIWDYKNKIYFFSLTFPLQGKKSVIYIYNSQPPDVDFKILVNCYAN